MRVAVLGCGRTGSRVALALARRDDVELLLVDHVAQRAEAVAAQLGVGEGNGVGVDVVTDLVGPLIAELGAALIASPPPRGGNERANERTNERGNGPRPSLRSARGVDVAVLCLPRTAHGPAARSLVAAGVGVVSVSDDPTETKALLDLGQRAADVGVAVVAGAGFCPGLSCLLARHAGNLFDEVEEVHVCRAGTGGPACARQHHGALTGEALDWRDGAWVRRRGGSGRQLAHFPDPIGPRDCYRAGLPDALLLQRAFPEARRITARLAATRRDRLSAPLPMLRAPHPDGGPGALRVEVWGRRDGAREVTIYGAMGSPADIAAEVAAVSAGWVLDGRFGAGVNALAQLADPVPFLAELDRVGVGFATFEGVA